MITGIAIAEIPHLSLPNSRRQESIQALPSRTAGEDFSKTITDRHTGGRLQ
jgi:hypothetical protein